MIIEYISTILYEKYPVRIQKNPLMKSGYYINLKMAIFKTINLKRLKLY